jgi:hypothetical protein
MRAARLLVSVIGLTAALSAAAHAEPFKGNDTGGIIAWSCENEGAAREIAGAHCASYGKYARITGVHRQYGDYISFQCLWNPRINPDAIPAVGTRACRSHAHVRSHGHKRALRVKY